MYLLDTCLISELVKEQPNTAVVDWLQEQSEFDCYLSVLTLGELEKGINKFPDSKKRNRLTKWLHQDIHEQFHHRILGVSEKIAQLWGRLQADAEKSGRTLPVVDGLLAATAKQHQLALVTRNVKDFDATDVEIINPWKALVQH